MATHDFGPAIEYYEQAIARDKARGYENNEMRSDLTMLYVKLRKFAEVRVPPNHCVCVWRTVVGGVDGKARCFVTC